MTMPAPHHSSFFTGRMLFLPPNQQRQSTEGNTEPPNCYTNLLTGGRRASSCCCRQPQHCTAPQTSPVPPLRLSIGAPRSGSESRPSLWTTAVACFRRHSFQQISRHRLKHAFSAQIHSQIQLLSSPAAPTWVNCNRQLTQCCPYQPTIAKCRHSEGLPPWPTDQGLCAWTPLRALPPDPEACASARVMCPLHTLDAPPAVATLCRHCMTLLRTHNERKSYGFCFCKTYHCLLQGGRTAAYPAMGWLIPAISCTLALNPAFSVASIESPHCVYPSVWLTTMSVVIILSSWEWQEVMQHVSQ